MNKFAPTANFTRSVIGIFFVTFRSVSKNFGPLRVFRGKFPNPDWSAAGTKSAVVAQGEFGVLQLRVEGLTANSATVVALRSPVTLPRLPRTPVLTAVHG